MNKLAQVATLIIGLALLSMLISNSKVTLDVVKGISGAFATLWRTATGGPTTFTGGYR